MGGGGVLEQGHLGNRCGLEAPGSWPPLFWVIFHSSHFREGNKEPCVSGLSLRDLGLQGLSWPGQPPSKVRH